MIYLDTSALIKRFVHEKGSLLVQSLVKREGAVATAKIAYAEIFQGSLENSVRVIWPKHSTPLLAASLTEIGMPIFELSWETISWVWRAT